MLDDAMDDVFPRAAAMEPAAVTPYSMHYDARTPVELGLVLAADPRRWGAAVARTINPGRLHGRSGGWLQLSTSIWTLCTS